MTVMPDGEGAFYRYGGKPRPIKTVPAEKFRNRLLANRRRLAYNSTSARSLSVRLNQQVAQALHDGIKATRLVEATGLSRRTIRTIGLSFDDLLPSGLPAQQRLAMIRGLASELAELEKSKADLERQRVKLLAAARGPGFLDDYELAALSGLQHEAIRKMTRGVPA